MSRPVQLHNDGHSDLHDHGRDHGHTHDHDHGHDHGHEHGATPERGWTLGAVPVLDIGGEVGAIIAYLPSATPSGEIEIAPVGDLAAKFHTGVHARDLGGVPGWIAVFPEVLEGCYDLLDEHLEPIARVLVRGGEVTEVDLRLAALVRASAGQSLTR